MDSMLKVLNGVRPATKRLPAEIVVRQSTAPPNPAAPSAVDRPAAAESAD
jgi:hypothetical protein